MQQTSAVRSSIASAKRSTRDRPVGLGPHVDDLGAAQLLRVRDLADGRELVLADHDLRPRAQVERGDDPLTPCVTEVVTASSAGSALSSRANAARAASARSTQTAHSAPFSSQPVEVLLVGGAHAVRERALRARVQVGRVREDRELAPDRRADLPGGDGHAHSVLSGQPTRGGRDAVPRHVGVRRYVRGGPEALARPLLAMAAAGRRRLQRGLLRLQRRDRAASRSSRSTAPRRCRARSTRGRRGSGSRSRRSSRSRRRRRSRTRPSPPRLGRLAGWRDRLRLSASGR